MMLDQILIREIKATDNVAVASLIRTTLAEFGANRPGTVYYDTDTDRLFEVFAQAKCCIYYVAELDGEVVGGGGIFPSPGLAGDTCELVKMYLYPKVRGIGLGKLIIEKCIAFAKGEGYDQIYLETMPELKRALKVYEKFGFQYINHSMGNTGHHGCDLWMLLRIKN
jgi:putative acetyltransferase